MNRKLRGFAGNLETSDLWLVGSVFLLLVLGSIVVYGAGSYTDLARATPLGQHYVIAKHLFMICMGFLLMLGLFHLDYHFWKKPWVNQGALALGLLAVGFTFLGDREIDRWIEIFGISVQPVEAAKIALVFFLSERVTSLSPERLQTWKHLGLLFALGPLPLIVMLVFQPNFGNILVVAAVTFVILLVAGVSLRKLGWFLASLVIAGAVAVPLVRKLNNRFSEWMMGLGHGEYAHQVKQSLIGLGAGGWRGLGVGQSHNKFEFLPESHTDFVFSVLGEEWGLAGTLVVLAAIVVIAWRGYGIALGSPDPFGRIVAAGLTTCLTVYGIVNIGMVTGLFPVIGVPLPFVSFGGTAMVGNLASVGILMNIDRNSRSFHLWKRRWDRT
ncbi:MAG: FtsW/RodA/SpoVE family cell cycle protein [Gemmatimonadales bacterium]|nr:FtsW/RodA/SpoVE family cell cycle protein [Gemmatimonadales bacterium]